MESNLKFVNQFLSFALQKENQDIIHENLDPLLAPLDKILLEIEKGSIQADKKKLQKIEIKLIAIQSIRKEPNQKLDDLVKKIHTLSSTALKETFEKSSIETSSPSDCPSEGFEILQKKEQSGSGPSWFDYTLSGFHTTMSKILQKKTDNSDLKDLYCEKNVCNGVLAAISSLRDYSSQCQSSDIDAFFYLLDQEKKLSCQVIKNFYYTNEKNFNELTCREALASIIEFLEKCDPKKPVAIPLVYSSKLFYGCESQHIAAILIQEGRLSYYDSRGITSDKKELKDGSLKEVLKGIATWFQDRGQNLSLSENTLVHQKRDSHLCGLFVMNFFHKKLCNSAQTPLFSNSLDSKKVYSELEDFRGNLLKSYLRLAEENRRNTERNHSLGESLNVKKSINFSSDDDF